MKELKCDGCTACCWGPVAIHPALGDNPKNYETETVKNYGTFLKRKSDGSCIYLDENGCRNYENRPVLCRAFDCRLYARTIAEFDPLVDQKVVVAGMSRKMEVLDVER